MLWNGSLIYLVTEHCIVVDTLQIYGTNVGHRAREQQCWCDPVFLFMKRLSCFKAYLHVRWESNAHSDISRVGTQTRLDERVQCPQTCNISVQNPYVFKIKTGFDSKSQPFLLASDRDDRGLSQGDKKRSVMGSIIDSTHWGQKRFWL